MVKKSTKDIASTLSPDAGEQPEAANEDPQPARRKKARKGHGRPTFPAHMPRETVELDLAESERCCPECGKAMRAFGEEVTERGHVVPGKVHRDVGQRLRLAIVETDVFGSDDRILHDGRHGRDVSPGLWR